MKLKKFEAWTIYKYAMHICAPMCLLKQGKAWQGKVLNTDSASRHA